MIRDIARFYRKSVELLDDEDTELSLGEYLDQNNYSNQFVAKHIIPMGSAIWSSGSEQIRNFPARLFVEFFYNHGFLKLKNRPQWRTITRGSSRYVEKLIHPFSDRIRLKCPVVGITRKQNFVEIRSKNTQVERFDHVVIATHSDQALQILTDARPLEREILGKIAYQHNETVLHLDTSLLPRTQRAWASWNYFIPREEPEAPAVTYYMNMLQNIQSSDHFCVSLNRTEEINPDYIIKKIDYQHPLFTSEAVKAQRRWSEISGRNRTHFCGAYWGYGFHEDGVNSALRVAEAFDRRL